MGAEGVKWVSNNSSPTLTRYHGAPTVNVLYSPASQAAATSYFDALAPWGLMGRVSMRPDGSVASRCKVNQTSLQTSLNWGDTCYSDTNDDSNGQQKMVYVPQYCLYVDALTANQVWVWVGQIGDKFRLSNDSADYTFSASDIQPAFNIGGVNKSGMFVGAYNGCKNTNFMGTGVTALESIAGVTPTATNAPLTIANARIAAQAIGAGWNLQTIQSYSAFLPLFIIEYASLGSQSILGSGLSQTTIQNTGLSTMYGNASYGTSANSTTVMSYRGIENIWGNLSTFLEGINIKGNYNPWIAAQSTASGYYDSTAFDGAKYIDTTATLATSGFITAISTALTPWAFLPTTATGDASTYFCDYLNIGTGTRAYFAGGEYNKGNYAGIFERDCQQTSVSNAAYGFRIQYFPP